MSNLNERDIETMLRNADSADAAATAADETSSTTRRVLVIGCGGGGCNISTIITDRVPEDVYTIAYDTSAHNMPQNVLANKKATIDGEDGAGKVRDYSKNLFKNGTYEKVLDYVSAGIDALGGRPDYILITTTADGGTGSGMSVILAKLLADNMELPVLVIGVYPTMQDDAQSQYNAMEWQTELVKVGIPYFILDNNIPFQQLIGNPEMKAEARMTEVYRKVNEQAARIGALLTGTNFGVSTNGMIDRRNLLMLTMKIGGRMVATSDTTRPTAGQTLDDYIEAMLQKSCQPMPYGVSGIGVWVKGPKDMLAQMDTSLPKLQAKYGNAMLKFAHVEEAPNSEIGIIMTGCDEAADRLAEMRHRYDDIMLNMAKRGSCTGELLSGATNPMAGGIGKRFGAGKEIRSSDEIDTSAFDM